MGIFQDEQHGALLREAAKEVHERQYGTLLLLSGSEVECCVAAVEGQRQECREQGCHMINDRGRLSESLFQFVELDLGGIVRPKPCCALELGDHGIERAIRMMGRALVLNTRMGLVDDLLPQRLDDPRLADPGLTGQEDDLAFAASRLDPALHQQADLAFATKKTGRTLRLPGLEAAFGRVFANDPPRRNWIDHSLEKLRAKILEIE